MEKYLLAALIGIAMLSGCNNIKKTTATSQSTMEKTMGITGKKWQLVELRGNAVPATINGKTPYIELLDADKRYSASAGCNGLGGTFTLKNNDRIKFSQGMSTMMACDNMEVETEFKKVLDQADNYTVKGNTLSLNKARMAPLARFQIIEENETAQLNGTWELDYISGPKIAFDGLFPNKKPGITFNLPETKATGNGGCNNFNVAFTVDGNSIRFNDPVSTRMACPGNGEATFFNTLKKVTKYSVNGNTLNMIMGDIAVMRFQKKLGKEDAATNVSGIFSWAADGNKIILDKANGNQLFLVGENQLFWLDNEGNRITGDLAMNYRLEKQADSSIY